MGEATQSSGGPLAVATPLFEIPLYALIAISAAALLLFLSFFFILRYRRGRLPSPRLARRNPSVIPTSTKEIAEIHPSESGKGVEELKKNPPAAAVEAVKPLEGSSSSGSSSSVSSLSAEKEKKLENIGWGRWYSLAELEAATAAFSPDNVIGEGGYGIVYRGVLPDLSVVAVKNLLNNKGQAEKEFKVEVEAIGKVRHKNLVGLTGYCAQGVKRMLVYEYIDNGTLGQWLHGDVVLVSPLSWNTRMKIAIGTAKGVAYLHEGLEPKVVHRDIKSSNILLDKQWNPKVSDFGLAKVLGSGKSYVTTRVMGTFGYVAPEYACTGMLNESSDVYSFGVLLMEIISGRNPVNYSRPVGEVNMVEWFKRAVQSKREEEVVDPLIKDKPSPRALKRALLICLRCTDMDAHKRPKMGQLVHMLEGDEFPFGIEHRSTREGTLTSSYMSVKVAPPANSERSMW